jgi:hypothetical protein
MKTGKIWIGVSLTVGVALGLMAGTPLRANSSGGYSCEKQWVLTFPAGQGNPLYCAQFEDGTQRCSVEALDIPTACANPALRDGLLMLR